MITAGTLRAARTIAAEFRERIPDLPESNQDVLAELIDTATGIGELVTILEETLKSISEWFKVYGPVDSPMDSPPIEDAAGGGEE
jgi:hypothetical protein